MNLMGRKQQEIPFFNKFLKIPKTGRKYNTQFQIINEQVGLIK